MSDLEYKFGLANGSKSTKNNSLGVSQIIKIQEEEKVKEIQEE